MSAAIAAVAAAAVAVVGTSYSIYEQNEARKETRKANRKAARIEAIKGQRSRVQALRDNRINESVLTNRAVSFGLGSSSGFTGAVASLDSTAAANQNFVSNIDQLSAQRLGALSRADNARALAGIGEGVSAIASQTLGIAGKIGG